MKGDKSEQAVVTGSKCGTCMVWEVKEGEINVKWSFSDFESSVLDLFIHDESKVCVASSYEGKIVIYNILTKELFRVLFHPENLPVHRVVLSFQPFGSLTLYSESDGKMYVYSVNGQLLVSKKFKGSRITDIQVSSDSNNMDFMVGYAHKGLQHDDWRSWNCELAFP